jgi:hypothetical protein
MQLLIQLLIALPEKPGSLPEKPGLLPENHWSDKKTAFAPN